MKNKIEKYFLLVLLVVSIFAFTNCGNAFLSGDAVKGDIEEENSPSTNQSDNSENLISNVKEEPQKGNLRIEPSIATAPPNHNSDESIPKNIDKPIPSTSIEPIENVNTLNEQSIPVQKIVLDESDLGKKLPVKKIEKTAKQELDEKINTLRGKFHFLGENMISFMEHIIGNDIYRYRISVSNILPKTTCWKINDSLFEFTKKNAYGKDLYNMNDVRDIKEITDQYIQLAYINLQLISSIGHIEFVVFNNNQLSKYINESGSTINRHLDIEDSPSVLNKTYKKFLFSEFIKADKKFISKAERIKKWLNLFTEDNDFSKSTGLFSVIKDISRKKKFNNAKDNVDKMIKLCTEVEETIKSVQSIILEKISSYIKNMQLLYEYFDSPQNTTQIYIDKIKYLLNLLEEKNNSLPISPEKLDHWTMQGYVKSKDQLKLIEGNIEKNRSILKEYINDDNGFLEKLKHLHNKLLSSDYKNSEGIEQLN